MIIIIKNMLKLETCRVHLYSVKRRTTVDSEVDMKSVSMIPPCMAKRTVKIHEDVSFAMVFIKHMPWLNPLNHTVKNPALHTNVVLYVEYTSLVYFVLCWKLSHTSFMKFMSLVCPEQLNCLLFFRKILQVPQILWFSSIFVYLNPFQQWLYDFEIHLFSPRTSQGLICNYYRRFKHSLMLQKEKTCIKSHEKTFWIWRSGSI